MATAPLACYNVVRLDKLITVISEGAPSVATGRRFKTYAADSGISYRYCFEMRRRVKRPGGQGYGSEFTFVIAGGLLLPSVARIFVADRALQAWQRLCGRDLDGTEQYAAAKMRLFRAFDDADQVGRDWLDLIVDESNLVELLEPLGLGQ